MVTRKMKCPKCKKEGAKFVEKKPLPVKVGDRIIKNKGWKRTDYSVRCKSCGVVK